MKLKRIADDARVCVEDNEYQVRAIWVCSSGPTLADSVEYHSRTGLRLRVAPTCYGFIGAQFANGSRCVPLSKSYSSQSELNTAISEGFQVRKSEDSLRIAGALLASGLAVTE